MDVDTRTAQLFNDTYERAVVNDYDRFFNLFYSHFVSSSPVVAKAFEGTVESRRHVMLEDSLLMLMDYSLNKHANEDLKKLAAKHKTATIPGFTYELWLESIINTLRDVDSRFTREYEDAWREILQPGIDYMLGYEEA